MRIWHGRILCAVLPFNVDPIRAKHSIETCALCLYCVLVSMVGFFNCSLFLYRTLSAFQLNLNIRQSKNRSITTNTQPNGWDSKWERKLILESIDSILCNWVIKYTRTGCQMKWPNLQPLFHHYTAKRWVNQERKSHIGTITTKQWQLLFSLCLHVHEWTTSIKNNLFFINKKNDNQIDKQTNIFVMHLHCPVKNVLRI